MLCIRDCDLEMFVRVNVSGRPEKQESDGQQNPAHLPDSLQIAGDKVGPSALLRPALPSC